ncbi:MAG: hypothetical protein ACK47C_07565 [Paracoccaceae bacterium]|jgi:hypothetical protein
MAKEFWVDSAVVLFDNTTFTYAAGSANMVTAGDTIISRKELYYWRVAASTVTSHHTKTAGGVKLFVDAMVVQPEMFGKVGTASLDTIAILAAIALNRDVTFPGALYRTTKSIPLSEQRLKGLAKNSARGQVVIQPQGNFPCFVNRSDYWCSFEIEGFFIDYGAAAPTTKTGNDLKIGFQFKNSSIPGSTALGWPEQFRISNCTVRGAWFAFYDESGSYMSVLERVEARSCKIGFFKAGGTTISFMNCFARGDGASSEMGFFIREVVAPSFIACAADGLKPAVNAFAGSANIFEGCQAVTINGWDAEDNQIGLSGSYMHFVAGTASVKGFVGLGNKLLFTTPGEIFFILNDACQLEFSGRSSSNPSDLKVVGSGAVSTTFLTINGGQTLLSSSIVFAAEGGPAVSSWAIRGGTGGKTTLLNTKVLSGSVNATEPFLTQSDVAALPFGAIGSVGLFLNASTTLITEGMVVPGSSLIWAASSGSFVGVDSPSGSWMCLGTCQANEVVATIQAQCTSLFKRIL